MVHLVENDERTKSSFLINTFDSAGDFFPSHRNFIGCFDFLPRPIHKDFDLL